MNKKCIGCGSLLQNTDEFGIGYTPDLSKAYCKRCFRLKNYGELERIDAVDENKILNKVNKQKGIAFFLVDYLNINEETLNIFRKIKIPKVFVVSKCDILRTEMKYTKIKKWLKEVYNLQEDVLFISSFKNNSSNLFKYMDEYNFTTAYIMGITNAGKSTYINKLLKENGSSKTVLASKKENTTLDFIRLNINDHIIYDTPGFTYSNLGKETKLKGELKPITYNLKENTTIIINDHWKYFFKEPSTITLYVNTNDIKREYKLPEKLNKEIKTFANSDIIIPGIGFINVKEKTCVLSNVTGYEVRRNISEVLL